jgi:hypothetical protein
VLCTSLGKAEEGVATVASGHKLPNKDAAVFISSADWMERNMDWRLENARANPW